MNARERRALSEKLSAAVTTAISEPEYGYEGSYVTSMQEEILAAVARGLPEVVDTALAQWDAAELKRDQSALRELRAQNKELLARVAELEAIDRMLTEARAGAGS